MGNIQPLIVFFQISFIIFIFSVEGIELCDLKPLENFRYHCGKEMCNPLSQYCEREDGVVPYCAYCSPDICHGDPTEYRECSLACHTKFLTCLTSTKNTVTTHGITEHVSTESPKTPTPPTDPPNQNVTKCQIQQSPSNDDGIYKTSFMVSTTIAGTTLLICIIQIVIICRLRQKETVIAENNYKDSEKQNHNSTENNLDGLKGSDIVKMVCAGRKRPQNGSFGSGHLTDSGIGTPVNTPLHTPTHQRRNGVDHINAVETRTNNETTAPKQATETICKVPIVANPTRHNSMSKNTCEVYPSGK